MKTLLLIPVLFMIMLVPMAFADSMTASTDKASYQSGENVVITGQITDVEDGHNFSGALTYVVITPDGLGRVQIGNLQVSGGSFSDSFQTGGPLWKLNGDYVIQINYGEINYSTSFEYTGGAMEPNPQPIEIIDEPEQSPEPVVRERLDSELEKLKSENIQLKIENKQLKNQINQLQDEIQRLEEKVDFLISEFVKEVLNLQRYFVEKYEN